MEHKTFHDRPVRTLRVCGALCRTVAALLISGVWPRRTFLETERLLISASLRQQVAIVSATLVLLVAGAFTAAQAGAAGLLAFLLLVILIAR